MTIQTAAWDLLRETGKPLSAREIARRALERRLVTSNARDPIESHAQSLEKNIREGTYNDPELAFIQTSRGRLVGLPEWAARGTEDGGEGSYGSPALARAEAATLPVQVPAELVEQVRLARQARVGRTVDETVAELLRIGLAASLPRIKAAIAEQMAELEESGTTGDG